MKDDMIEMNQKVNALVTENLELKEKIEKLEYMQ